MTFPSARPMRGQFEPQTEALIKIWAKASERDRSVLGEMHVHYEHEIMRMAAEGNPGHNVAHTLHTLIDQATARLAKTPNGRKIKCTKGCSACCRLHVSITRAEASLIALYCEHAGVAIDWPRLERQSEHSLSTWNEQDPGDRRCVFLDGAGECSIYEHRPAACRKYFVASDPRNCDTVRRPGAEVMNVVSPEAEVFASASLARMVWGSMARMLLAERQEAKTDNENPS